MSALATHSTSVASAGDTPQKCTIHYDFLLPFIFFFKSCSSFGVLIRFVLSMVEAAELNANVFLQKIKGKYYG